MSHVDSSDISIDLSDITSREPEIPAEQSEPFEEAALIGGEQLQSAGFFVNIVKRGPEPHVSSETPLVVVVEDEPGTQRMLDAVLRSRGFSTRLAGNLAEIQRALSTKPYPDLILLDVLLPDANGFAVLERLRRHPDYDHTPVVMLTSLSEPAEVARGLALGATGYMSKPARPQALIAALHTALGIEA